MNILIIQEIIAFYRIDLFKQLEERMSKDVIHFAYGQSKKAAGRVGEKNPGFKNNMKLKNYSFGIFGFSITFQTGIVKSIIKTKPEIVVFSAHSGNISYWIILALSKLLRFKTIGWVCGWENKNSNFKNMLFRIFIRNIDYCLAYHTTASSYLKRFGVEENRIRILYNTINEQKILDKLSYYKQKAVEMRKSLSICGKVLLFVGAILKEKNLECLIEAAMVLKDYTLIIVGDGEYREYLMGYTDKLKIKNIIFTGKIIDDVDVYFEMCDIFILPGTGGLAINQALAHSKPIICGKADGSELDLVIENQNGYILKDINSNKIVEAVKKIEMQGIEDMGRYSFEIIQNKFTFNNFVENYIFGIDEVKKLLYQ